MSPRPGAGQGGGGRGQGGGGRGRGGRGPGGGSGRSQGRAPRNDWGQGGRDDRRPAPRDDRQAGGPQRDRARAPRQREEAALPSDRLVYGRNPVRELLRAARRPVQQVYATTQVADVEWLAAAPVTIVSGDELADLAGTGDHQGVVAECGTYPYVPLADLVGKPGVVVVLDEITDPRNVGAIARSAEATGAVGLVLPERRSAHVTATVCKTSAGAIEHLKVAEVRNLSDALADLKAGGAWTYGAAMDGTPVGDLDLTGSVVFVLGGEGRGLRPRVAQSCDALVSLPMVGHVDSLNVSAAATVLLYTAFNAQR